MTTAFSFLASNSVLSTEPSLITQTSIPGTFSNISRTTDCIVASSLKAGTIARTRNHGPEL